MSRRQRQFGLNAFLTRRGVVTALVIASSVAWSSTPSADDTLAGARLIPAQFIIGHEPMKVDEFAAHRDLAQEALERNFGASGYIECNGKQAGSASVVGAGDVLTTAGHNFYTPSCEARYESSTCRFHTTLRGSDYTIELATEVARGFTCPMSPELGDWLVFKLRHELPAEILPYDVGDSSSLVPGDDVLAISGQTGDVLVKGGFNGKYLAAKTFSECYWEQKTDREGARGFAGLGCSASLGSSGGTLLNGNREFVGMASKSSELGDDLARRYRLMSQNHKPLVVKRCHHDGWPDPLQCATFYIPVEGAFREAILNAAGIQNN
jgi:hypothetical protein